MESIPDSLQIIILAQEVLRGIKITEGGACVVVALILGKGLAKYFADS